MKETHQVDVSPCKDVPTDDLAAQIKRLEGQLGFEESFAGGSVKTGASVPGVDDGSEGTGLKNSSITIAAQSNLSIRRQTSKVSYCFTIGRDVN